MKVIGTEKKLTRQQEEDKRITAYHEAGHAVVTYHLPDQDPLHIFQLLDAVWLQDFAFFVRKMIKCTWQNPICLIRCVCYWVQSC